MLSVSLSLSCIEDEIKEIGAVTLPKITYALRGQISLSIPVIKIVSSKMFSKI